jgi:hypothetical protein
VFSAVELNGIGKLFYTLGVYAAVVIYIVLALLKLYMVARPLRVRNAIRLKHCLFALGISWITPPILVALIASILFLLRFSITANPGDVFKHIINWLPLVAHVILLVIYAATGGLRLV